jgi:hypothetical protein
MLLVIYKIVFAVLLYHILQIDIFEMVAFFYENTITKSSFHLLK